MLFLFVFAIIFFGDIMDYFSCCKLCPRECCVDRHNTIGFCRANDKLKIARAALHFFEEPPISGTNGSGAIFFSNCNLRCVFCQNYQISSESIGKEVSVSKFSDICINLQNQGALNINLVTPTHYVPLIREGLILAKKKGLTIPIVYNTSSYESVSTIKMLNGIVDVYLPDLKYYSNELAIKYSSCPDYFKYATSAIEEMYRQVGSPVFDDNGIIKSGVIVRHLMLPGCYDDSVKIIDYLYEKYQDNIFISIMNQYTPIKELKFSELNCVLSNDEYYKMIDYAYNLGIRNCFVQEEGTQKKSFIPDFSTQEF